MDSSFTVACLSYEQNCLDLLDVVAGKPIYVSSVVWAEAVHALVRSYVADDLLKAMTGQEKELVNPAVGPALLKALLRDKAQQGGFRLRAASHDILKAPSAELRQTLLPYQRAALTAVDNFLFDSGALVLGVDESVLQEAKAICRVAPCDTNDALHLALARKGECSYAITKDADWVRIPDALRPSVVRVA